MAVMLAHYKGHDGRMVRVWQCEICKHPFEWHPDAHCYGAEGDILDGRYEDVAVFCSSRCKSVYVPPPVKRKRVRFS
jgi:hypothetical protein